MKSDRSAALLLMAAALLGIVVANSPFGVGLQAIKEYELDLGILRIDVEHVTSEFLLAIFFMVAGLELKHELRLGALSTLRAALIPIVSAVAGVLVPALIYISLNPTPPNSAGWPIPIATDIAFALGMLAIIGRGLPSAARVFLLALAIFDDLIAIFVIAFGFTRDLQIGWLLMALGVAVLTRVLLPQLSGVAIPTFIFIAFMTSWILVYQSGVHATIAGVLIGLAVPARGTHLVASRIQPFSNAFVLPLFAFFAVSIALPEEFTSESSVFLGVAVALPMGKLLGIAVIGVLMNRLAPEESRLKLSWLDFSVVASLAGIGFTVSLLLAKLSFPADPILSAEAVFGVLVGSMSSVVLAVAFTALRRNLLRRR